MSASRAPFTLCCVLDAHPRLYLEIVLWVLCATQYLPRDKFRLVVYLHGDIPRDLVHWITLRGVEIRVAGPMVEGSPHCNKITPFFDHHESEFIIVCDSDLFFVRDPSELLPASRGIRAAPNNHGDPPARILKDVLAASGLSRPYRPGEALLDGGEGRETHINNINAGIVIAPSDRAGAFAAVWKKWAEWLVVHRDLLDRWIIHVDQVAFMLAMEELGEDVEFLSPQVNAILHMIPELADVFAFHLSSGHIPGFPDAFGPDRTLRIAEVSHKAATAIARLNMLIPVAARLASVLPATRDHLDTFLNPGWRRDAATAAGNAQPPDAAVDARRALPIRKPRIIVGTGWWCEPGTGRWLIGDQAAKTPEFFGLWLYLVRQYIDPAEIIVLDNNAPLKPAQALRDGIKWVELDRNYGSPNDIRVGTIATKYCGYSRSLMLGAMFALCSDADIYCYVEQDCVVRGRGLIDAALAGRELGILVGAPTENGRGLHGDVAAPMHQNSLVIVGRSSLERFVAGLVAGPETDGELSPEVKLVRDCAPVELLAIPYGRSRPVDFDRPHYYVEHLVADELRRFLAVEGLTAAQFGLPLGEP